MAMKSIVLLVSLLVVVFASSQAEAQLNLISINGTIFCSMNGNIVPNAATPTPAFANASVQVMCDKNVVSSAITNGAGVFNMVLDPRQFLLSDVLTSCRLVVATPLTTCNPSLPAVGNLQAPLKFTGNPIPVLLDVAFLSSLIFDIVGV